METTKRILIVEDDDIDAEHLIRAFNVVKRQAGHNFELHRENNLARGVAALESTSYDLVFLDLGLPDAASNNSLPQIKSLFPNIPIVVLTGLNDEDMALQSLRDGAQDYLVKGQSSPQELLRCSVYAMERHRLKRELEKTASELSQKTAILQSIINNMGDGVIVTDRKGEMTLFNPAAVNMLDVSWMESSPSDWPLAYGAFEPAGMQKLQPGELPISAVLRGENVDDVEMLVRTEAYPDGRYVSVTARSIKDEKAAIGGCVAVLHDITKRRKLDQLKDEFVSVVSHELRTPLTSISGSLGLLLGGIAGDLPEEVREMIGIARRNSDRLVRLINDLLDIQKLEAGKMTLNRQPVNLQEMLLRSLEANEGYATKYHVQYAFENDVDPEMVAVVDEDRILQVMANLLSNAAKYSPEHGTITVKVGTTEKNELLISVRDEGEGIPEEFQPSIFGKFAQADASTTRQKEGTGLGLSICKAIVDLHGGDIYFESEAGQGTTFFFTLPAS